MSFTTDPLWPWSLPTYGALALLTVAALLIALTVWTYRGVSLANGRRVSLILLLRLAALLLAIAALIRPALASRDDLKVPSVLIVLLDRSESMTIHDASAGLSRWDELRRVLEMARPTLQDMAENKNVTVVIKCFAEDLEDFDPNRPADGKRTDFGTALNKLFATHGQERFLRGLLVISDGANNGVRFDAMAEAEKWRRRSCPIHTFALGQTTAPAKQRDIAVVNIVPTPAPVPVKNKLTITVTIDAPGFENALVPVRLFIDDKEVAVQEERLTKTVGNEVQFSINAPDKSGEIKVTVKVDPQVGEVIQANNEISTFVTVAKEGLSVLYVYGRLGSFEPKFVREALKDPRIRVDELLRLTDDPLTPTEADVLRFDKQHYDVIILGDISARRLSGGDAAVLQRVHDEVTKKGAGLMMLGGFNSLGSNSDWQRTAIADILPLDLSTAVPQEDKLVQMTPTQQGLARYLMRLDSDPAKNKALWDKLSRVNMTMTAKEKPGAVVLARAGDGTALLVSQDVGARRTLAFPADETGKWRNLGLPKTREGLQLHSRFWKQVVLWLAHQEEATGNVWVRPDARRLPAGAKQGITAGLRGKGGLDLPDAEISVKVIDPNKGEHAVSLNREAGGQRGVFERTELSGEYTIVAQGKGKDSDGSEISGEARARFLIYQDTAELARQAADHEFLARLANTGGGKAMRADDFPRFLKELRSQPPPQSQRAKTDLYPDWKKNRTTPFLPAFFLVFVAILSLEWFLRRSWGLV
jgi:uncharacterized membrane protein